MTEDQPALRRPTHDLQRPLRPTVTQVRHTWSHPQHTKHAPGFRILVVDDHRESADAMAALLCLLGNQARTGYNGGEAICAFLQFRPDVIVLDINMPVLDGIETASAIRSLPGGDAVLLIALSGQVQRADKKRSREAGFDHHSAKPVDVIILQRLIEVRSRQKSANQARAARIDANQHFGIGTEFNLG